MYLCGADLAWMGDPRVVMLFIQHRASALYRYNFYFNLILILLLTTTFHRKYKTVHITAPNNINVQALPILINHVSDFVGLAGTSTYSVLTTSFVIYTLSDRTKIVSTDRFALSNRLPRLSILNSNRIFSDASICSILATTFPLLLHSNSAFTLAVSAGIGTACSLCICIITESSRLATVGA